ncbi:hypothetical protein QG516_03955 [Pedobacter gandavensis]|uniref:hypothetical protein n=1 Tax=Pedobacter gandavensis TaxID=2679963 RepID=UPI002479B423|nr:hypothetical protein [Pedobacter gandavensis]WGQ10807.1 hypothetical protein QG516_03955 [Pedobacter gandavensis]
MNNHEQGNQEATNAEISEDLLKKSADLKERAAELKKKMEQTQKASIEVLQSKDPKP